MSKISILPFSLLILMGCSATPEPSEGERSGSTAAAVTDGPKPDCIHQTDLSCEDQMQCWAAYLGTDGFGKCWNDPPACEELCEETATCDGVWNLCMLGTDCNRGEEGRRDFCNAIVASCTADFPKYQACLNPPRVVAPPTTEN